MVGIFWLIVFLMLLFMGYTSFFYWRYRLEFDETHVRLRTPVYFGRRPFTCAYNDIVQVRRGPLRGILTIVPREGKPLHLGPGSFEGERNQIVDILAQRVPSDVIEEGLTTSLWQYTRVDRLGWMLVVLLWLFLIIQFSMDIGLDIVRGRIAWETVQQLPPSTYVQSFGVDEDEKTIWVVLFEDFGNPGKIQRLTPASIEQWDLPASSDGMLYRFPIGFAHDTDGYPIVIYDEQILQWAGTEWKTQRIAGGKIMERQRGLIISGTQLWALVVGAENETTLIQIDITTGEQQQAPLPEPAIQAGQQLRGIRKSAEGALTLWTADETRSQFYAWRDGQWSELAYLEPEPETQVVDFTLSPSGILWTLLRSNDLVYTAASWNVIDTTWTQYTLPALEGALNMRYEGRIEVDVYERIWLPGMYETRTHRYTEMIRVLQSDASHKLRQVMLYTEHNSNYHSSLFSLYYAPDGRLWNAGGELVWIDTQVPTLPRPLPTWLAELEGSWWERGFQIGDIVLLVLLMIFGMHIVKRWSNIEKSSRPR